MKYDDLKSLKELLDEGLVTEEEYEIQKSRILGIPIKPKQSIEEVDDKGTEELGVNSTESKVAQVDRNDTVDDKGAEKLIENTTESETDQRNNNDTVDGAAEGTERSLKDTENDSDKSEDIPSSETTEESISRLERTNKGNMKQILWIAFSVVVVFIIGCFLGYQIFK